MLPHDPSLKPYLAAVSRRPRLSPAHERRLFARLDAGDASARDRIVEANLHLVVAVARRYSGLGLEAADLVQEGNLGLLKAIEKFDPARGIPFATYAPWWIRNAICTALSAEGQAVAVPERVKRAAPAVRRAQLDLRVLLGRPATPEEIAAAAGVTVRAVEDVRVAYLAPAPLDAAPDRAAEADAPASRDVPDTAWAQLTPRRRRVVELRFGLAGHPPRTLREIAAELGISKQRVRDIETSAIAQLRRLLLHSDFGEVA